MGCCYAKNFDLLKLIGLAEAASEALQVEVKFCYDSLTAGMQFCDLACLF